jgi:hypothetical protein
VRAEDSGLARFPVVKKAISDPVFSAKMFSDAEQSANAPKGSDVHRNFIQEYFSGNKGQVVSTGLIFD